MIGGAIDAGGTHSAPTDDGALRDALSRRSAMLDSLTEGLILIGADSVLLEWNRAAESILGFTAEQMSGRSAVDIAWAAIRDNGLPWPGDEHPIMLALTTGEVVAEQTMGIELPSGDVIWLKVNARPVFDVNGVVVGAVATFRDVTASVELQRRSNALAHQLRIAIESGAIGTALIDIEGRLTFANVAFSDMVGHPESLTGVDFLDLVEGDRRVMEIFEGPIGSRGLVIEDVPLRSKGDEGERRWVRLHLSRLPDARGDSSMLVQASDSTALRSARLELARSEELARVCLDALDQGVAFASESMGFHRVNSAFQRMLGYTAAELLEAWFSPDWEMFDADLRPLSAEGFVGFRAVELGEPLRDEISWMRHRDGSWRCLSCSAFPFGWTDEVVVVAVDLTDGLPSTALRPSDGETLRAG
jgi:PAS domain S-box-containing protein